MGVSVYVVDDDPDIRALVRSILSSEDIDVGEAASADDLLALLDDGKRPDLILLDLTLPGASGWTVLPKLQDDPWRAKIPVVILTAHDDAQFRETAKARGVADYITKPFDRWQLMDAVKHNVRKFRKADPWAR